MSGNDNKGYRNFISIGFSSNKLNRSTFSQPEAFNLGNTTLKFNSSGNQLL